MKEAVRDLVMWMTGGNVAVAELCASTVADVEEGDVCRLVNEKEKELLSVEPSVACFVDDPSQADCEEKPFVVCGDLFYTRRNWMYERNVARRIAAMSANVSDENVELPQSEFYLKLRDEQRAAVVALCKAQFTILTGGPGTGKTHTIARAVRYLQETKPGLRLALAAPTGKAAARMKESMAEMVSAPATTIHSLLGSRYDLVNFIHDRDNPLAIDWLIVDEASMIGLPLMSKLLDALPDNCKLTLVGDEDQLASVERGRVFADLCRMPGVAISRLRESTRFPPGGDIARIADAVNGNRPDEAMSILLAEHGDVVNYVNFGAASSPNQNAWTDFMKLCRDKFASFASSRDIETALARLNEFRVLCALRRGMFGVERLNVLLKEMLGRGCPIPMMITQNDKLLDVNNGDVGVIMPDDPRTLHLQEKDGIRSVRLELLPGVETAFATTIHKSQGSEFGDVAIVLPPGGDSPLLTRELLYTGITRTKGAVHIFASEESIRTCCGRAVERVTGRSRRQ